MVPAALTGQTDAIVVTDARRQASAPPVGV